MSKRKKLREERFANSLRGFTRTIEDFICEKCGARVTGNGYTNHCPSCLWSKHVDENPGDRASLCGGEMEPMSLKVQGGARIILHRCGRCGFTRRQHASASDSAEALAALSTRPFRE